MYSPSLIAFLLSLSCILYVLFGYPLLVGVLARVRHRPVRKKTFDLSVSIILPVHNGASFVGRKLESILALAYPKHLIEVLVVSDGSTDGTDSIIRSFADPRVRLLIIPRGGKARAINRALAEARNDVLVLTDVRQMLDPASLRNLIDCFGDPSVGVVSGNVTNLTGQRFEEENIGLYRRYEGWIRTQLSASSSVLGASGCYYAIRRSLARPIPDDTLLDDVYLPLSAIFDGYRCILETSARCFDYPTALDSEFVRKVRTQAGVYQLIGFFPSVLAAWTPTGFHFLSLKVGRLMLPFAFVVLLISSFGLPAPWNLLALACQAAFYGTAALDFVLPEHFPMKRLTSPFRSFVVLVASAACALSFFFVNPHDLWKQTVVRTRE